VFVSKQSSPRRQSDALARHQPGLAGNEDLPMGCVRNNPN
jgi:hypothetical protein